MSDQGFSGQPLLHLHDLRRPLIVTAFTGWNDAGNAASHAAEHLGDLFGADLVFELEPDDFYDFQSTRPRVLRPEPGVEVVTWPTTSVHLARLSHRDLVLIVGPEPSMRWRQFVRTLVSMALDWEEAQVVSLGAMLADVSHRRPVQVSGSSTDPQLAHEFDLELPDYEGPTGITGVLAAAFASAGIPTVSFWAAVPHYVSSPSPKATVALLNRVEDVLGTAIDLGELPELARAWERGVDELAADDSEIAEYIEALEEEVEEVDLPEASGDAIAAEFQRYLRRRDG